MHDRNELILKKWWEKKIYIGRTGMNCHMKILDCYF